jgi:putative methyltransferase (TIGR04325 family)
MKQSLIQHIPDRLFVSLKGYGWYGNFPAWQDAQQVSVGYDADNIIQRVRASLLKVKNGEAVYERDSVLFDTVDYAWELLSALLWIAAQNKGSLRLIDFGGSLGSTYFQNKRFLDKLASVSWNIVEQPAYVKAGLADFQDETLRFYNTIADCYSDTESIHATLFSSVLQYLDNPFDVLKEITWQNCPYIIVDRTGFTPDNTERITVQKVPDSIYKATYPCRFFGEKRFLNFFEENGYDLIAGFDALDKVNIPSKYKGFIFKHKDA